METTTDADLVGKEHMVEFETPLMSSPGSVFTDPTRQQATAAVAVEVPPNTVRAGKPYEKALITKWIMQARVPGWLREGWEQWKKDREYLHTEIFAANDARKLTVNLAARAIQKKEQKIAPSNADVSVTWQRGVGSVEDVRLDAIRQVKAAFEAQGIPLQAPVLIMAAEKAEQQYRDELSAKERYCQSAEALVKKLWDEAKGTLTAQHFGRQAMTVGPAFLKIGWQREFGKDSLGRVRTDDAQDQLKLLGLRSAEFANGMFGAEDPRYGELMMLSDFARQVGRKVVDGDVEPGSLPFQNWTQIADTRDGEPVPSRWLPEPDVWQGATIDTVRPESLRWDWRVPFSRMHESMWMMEQVLMDVDECAARFNLTPAERDRLGTRNQETTAQRTNHANPSSSSEAANPDMADFEAQVQMNQVVVWERWDKSLRRRCIFVEGIDRFLVNEVPGLVAPDFYPYVQVAFDEFDGKHLPLSTVCFLRKIQNAINQRLTDGEESLWASMKRYLVKKGAFKDGEIEKLRGATPHDVIEVESPEEISKTLMPLASDDWNGEKYNLDQLFRLFELVAGMSISELGVTGQADFATEAAIADASSKTTSDRHGQIMAKALSRAMTIILHYAATSLSEKTVKGLVGRAAYWPLAPTRMDLLRTLSITVAAAGSTEAANAKASTQVKEAMVAVQGVLNLRMMALQQGATFDAQPLLKAIFRTINLDAPAREVLNFNQAPQAGMPMPGQQPALQPPPGVPAA